MGISHACADPFAVLSDPRRREPLFEILAIDGKATLGAKPQPLLRVVRVRWATENH